jgi:hypothetical protein
MKKQPDKPPSISKKSFGEVVTKLLNAGKRIKRKKKDKPK